MTQVLAAIIVGALTIVAYWLPYHLELRRREAAAGEDTGKREPVGESGPRLDGVPTFPRSREEYVAKLYDQFTYVGAAVGMMAAQLLWWPKADPSPSSIDRFLSTIVTAILRAGLGALAGAFLGIILAKVAERIVKL